MRIFLRVCIESPWWNFTTPLEPILAQNVKNCEPRRLARQAVLRSSPENPLHIFCNFPRRDFIRKKVKGVLGGCAVALATLADFLRVYSMSMQEMI